MGDWLRSAKREGILKFQSNKKQKADKSLTEGWITEGLPY